MDIEISMVMDFSIEWCGAYIEISMGAYGGGVWREWKTILFLRSANTFLVTIHKNDF